MLRFDVGDTICKLAKLATQTANDFVDATEVQVAKPNLYTNGWTGKPIAIVEDCRRWSGNTTSTLIRVRFPDGEEYDYAPSSLMIISRQTGHTNKVIHKIQKEGNIMSERKPLTGYNRVAGIRIQNKVYYYALYDEPVEAGTVVQVTGRMAGQNLTVDSVMSFEDYDGSHIITEEVCAVVFVQPYIDRKTKREAAEKLMKKMDAEIAKMNEMDKYARYADINPEVAALFNQLKELGV